MFKNLCWKLSFFQFFFNFFNFFSIEKAFCLLLLLLLLISIFMLFNYQTCNINVFFASFQEENIFKNSQSIENWIFQRQKKLFLILTFSLLSRNISCAFDFPFNSRKYSRLCGDLHGAKSPSNWQSIFGFIGHRRFVCCFPCDDIRWREWHFGWVDDMPIECGWSESTFRQLKLENYWKIKISSTTKLMTFIDFPPAFYVFMLLFYVLCYASDHLTVNNLFCVVFLSCCINTKLIHDSMLEHFAGSLPKAIGYLVVRIRKIWHADIFIVLPNIY